MRQNPMHLVFVDVFAQAVANAAARFGLTGREEEVLSQLARGRNAQRAGLALFLSAETVKSHGKSIYRKMGVHTQQELIDRVMEEEGLLHGAEALGFGFAPAPIPAN